MALEFGVLEASWLPLIMSFLQKICAVTLLMNFGEEPLSFELFLLVILATWFGFLSFIVGVLNPLLVWVRHRVFISMIY